MAGDARLVRIRNLLFAPIVQAVAGTTEVVALTAGKRVYVVNYFLVLGVADGTFKWTDSGGDLSGAAEIARKGGAAPVGDVMSPLLRTAVGSALSIVTTGGAANGHLTYFLEA